MKKYRCQKCGVLVPMRENEFPLECQCGAVYATPADMSAAKSTDAQPVFFSLLVGVGTELKELFREVEVSPDSSCQCEAKAAEMDRAGIEFVKANRGRYIDWLREAYTSL